MAEQMTTNPNPTSSIRAIMRMAKGAFGIGKGALFLYRPEDQVLELVAEGSVEERQPGLLAVPTDARRYFLAEGGFPIMEWDHAALQEFLAVNADTLAGQPGAIWLPLAVNRHFLGLLMLGEKLSKEPLTQTELDILILIGRQFAVALHNFSLNVDLKTANMQLGLKVRQLEQLYDISRDITSTLDRSKITREVIVRAIELLDARKGMLLTLGEGGNRLDPAASFGFAEPPALPMRGAREGWLGGVLIDGEPLLLDEGVPPELEASSCIAVPVAYQGRVFGVLAVFDKEDRAGVGAFAEEDVPLLVNLASQAATAIENARLYELATVDGLTKLFIRRHFEQRLTEELTRARRYDTRVSLMILDIDHFKRFNDSWGHATGDEVLKLVARTIKAIIREDVDIPARYGGEEMLVLMPETDADGAWAMAERVREAIEAVPLPGPTGEVLHVTASVGVATWPLHARDEEGLLEAADKALYRSKQAGRNRSTMWQDSPVA
jgi:diguanylate cyclase (GGDEF)-like protein